MVPTPKVEANGRAVELVVPVVVVVVEVEVGLVQVLELVPAAEVQAVALRQLTVIPSAAGAIGTTLAHVDGSIRHAKNRPGTRRLVG